MVSNLLHHLSTTMVGLLHYPAIDPIAFRLGPLELRWYGLAYVVGIALGVGWMKYLVRKNKEVPITSDQLTDFLLWILLGIIVGGRIGYILFYNLSYYMSNPLQILEVWHGGMSFHGGVLGLVIATYLFTRKKSFSFLQLADLLCFAAPLGLFLGRIANFINGELYGRITNVPWAMVFPAGGPYPRHPSQLYEAFFEGIVLFCFLFAFYKGTRNALGNPGRLTGAFLLGYGIIRFCIEYVRQPDPQVGILADHLTMGQTLCLPMILIGLYLLIRSFRGSRLRPA